MTTLFLSAFLLGLMFNAMPGAIFAESLRRGIRGGFRPAFAIQIGSLLGDFVWAVLGLMGVAALFALPHVEKPLSLAGATLLGWIAWQALRDGLLPMPIFNAEFAANSGKSELALGAAMSLSNPSNITYWAGLGGTVAAFGFADPGWQVFLLFLAGFMTASVLWCFICAGAIAWSRRRIGPVLWRVLNFVCALGLAYFAALVTWRTLI